MSGTSGVLNGGLAARMVLGAIAIVVVFFVFQRESFGDVWKPLALYTFLAAPAYILMDRMRARADASKG